MAYTIATKIIDPIGKAHIIERTIGSANGGGATWTTTDATEMLTMGGSGTSGALRFKNGASEYFVVVLGVHNYVRWCDIITDLGPSDTAQTIQAEYYTDGNPRGGMLWKQLPQLQKTSLKGTAIDVEYVVPQGNNLVARINIFCSCRR